MEKGANGANKYDVVGGAQQRRQAKEEQEGVTVLEIRTEASGKANED